MTAPPAGTRSETLVFFLLVFAAAPPAHGGQTRGAEGEGASVFGGGELQKTSGALPSSPSTTGTPGTAEDSQLGGTREGGGPVLFCLGSFRLILTRRHIFYKMRSLRRLDPRCGPSSERSALVRVRWIFQEKIALSKRISLAEEARGEETGGGRKIKQKQSFSMFTRNVTTTWFMSLTASLEESLYFWMDLFFCKKKQPNKQKRETFCGRLLPAWVENGANTEPLERARWIGRFSL